MEKPSVEETMEFDSTEGKINDGLYTQPRIGGEIEEVEEPLTPVDQAIGAKLPKRSLKIDQNLIFHKNKHIHHNERSCFMLILMSKVLYRFMVVHLLWYSKIVYKSELRIKLIGDRLIQCL